MVKSGFHENMAKMNEGNYSKLSAEAQNAVNQFSHLIKRYNNLIAYLSLPIFPLGVVAAGFMPYFIIIELL
ncbi:hypothetical protein [Pedobacter sp. JCM 36344]|uniref:hypothetical protein n=1 Tax=Pedobacter sp. JCM 36344 TaxID=3374280 RepID=UPI00397E86CC